MDELLRAGFAALGLPLDAAALARFQTYYTLLDERSKVMNLTAIHGETDVAQLHFLDSAALLTVEPLAGKSVIDVGTGAGFPGLPLKITQPDISLTLLDSLDKRVTDVTCLHARAEEAPELRGQFDAAVSRAVARLYRLCELCLPFVRTGGVFLAMKGPDCTEELDEARSAIRKLGGTYERTVRYTIPGTDVTHSVVVIRKTAPTPPKYPRRWAQIKKQPGRNHGVRHALTLEQQRAFINYIESNPTYYRWTSLFKFLLGTGCRIGEAIGIRWEDVNFEKRVISINHSLVYYSREFKEHPMCTFSISLPKTEAGIRTIPMMDAVYDALRAELADQQENGFNETEIDGMKGFIFTNRFGYVHNPQSINRAIKRIYESYNAEEVVNASKQHREPVLIPHFSCHHLRHNFCSRFCENETNLIQSIMGHANIETTMDIYAEVTDAKKQEAIENLAHKLDVF